MLRFGIIGDGYIAQRHKRAICSVGEELTKVCDIQYLHAPSPYQNGIEYYPSPTGDFFHNLDYVVVSSPTHLHREHVRLALQAGCEVIVEKPFCLPWEPLIDDDRINIVLQLRYLDGLPKKADSVQAIMVRNQEYFQGWKGDPLKAGGNLYEFFIHYIDLAIRLKADFEGVVKSEGEQSRKIFYSDESGEQVRFGVVDILKTDQQILYHRLYQDILLGRGIKPKDIFYLTWTLHRYSEKFGFRNGGIHQPVVIPHGCL